MGLTPAAAATSAKVIRPVARVRRVGAAEEGGRLGMAREYPPYRGRELRPRIAQSHRKAGLSPDWWATAEAAARSRGSSLPPRASAEVREELRKLIGYFENNRHRTDYPTYRQKGWDIGSGPTEAGCKIIGERLKGSGMRWVEDGAVTVAALRALYVSGGNLWDGFWSHLTEPPRESHPSKRCTPLALGRVACIAAPDGVPPSPPR